MQGYTQLYVLSTLPLVCVELSEIYWNELYNGFTFTHKLAQVPT